MRSDGSLFSLVILALIAVAPLTAATFVGRRMGYRGIALIAPWGAAVTLGLLIGFGFSALGAAVQAEDQATARSMVVSNWISAVMLSGYLTTLIYLIVLAARRLPLRPADTAAVF